MLFSNVFSDMFDDMFDMPTANQNAKGLMNCDVKEYDDHYELDLDMAGFKKGDIKAELKDGYLTIKAERKSDDEETDQKGRVIRSERFMGTCQRTFYVGDHVKIMDGPLASFTGVVEEIEAERAQEGRTAERGRKPLHRYSVMDDRRRRRGQMQFTPGAKAPGALSFWGEKSAFEKNP